MVLTRYLDGMNQAILSFSVIVRNTRHGLPAAITPEGMSCVTTLPAPIIISFPMLTPGTIVTFPHSQTRLPRDSHLIPSI